MMNAIEVTGDNDFALVERPLPQPGVAEVLIRVRAAGINRADVLQRLGMYPAPKGVTDIPGLECAGEVVACGQEVTEWKVGDEVCALLPGGGYADYVAADAGSVLPKPPDMDWVEAASLPEGFFTVYANTFDACRLAEGERYLIHGGTSGIGVTAIQMARMAGCEVFTTAGTPRKCDVARSLGAHHAINYREDDFEAVLKEAGGVDVILDMVGGDYIQKNINVLRQDGRCANIAYQKGPVAEVNFLRVMLKRIVLTGSTLRVRALEDKRRFRDAIASRFWPMELSGDFKPTVDQSYPLAEARTAHARMESGEHVGKIILEV